MKQLIIVAKESTINQKKMEPSAATIIIAVIEVNTVAIAIKIISEVNKALKNTHLPYLQTQSNAGHTIGHGECGSGSCRLFRGKMLDIKRIKSENPSIKGNVSLAFTAKPKYHTTTVTPAKRRLKTNSSQQDTELLWGIIDPSEIKY